MPSLACKGGVGEGFAVPGTIWYDPGRIRTIQMVGFLRIRPTVHVVLPGTANPYPALPLRARGGMRSFGLYENTGGDTAVGGCTTGKTNRGIPKGAEPVPFGMPAMGCMAG